METQFKRSHLVRATTVAAAMIYGTGALVSSIHLGRFGVLDLQLIKLQNILSGFWCWLPFIITISIREAIFTEVKDNKGKPFKLAYAIIGAIITPFAAIGCFAWLPTTAPIDSHSWYSYALPIAAILLVSALILGGAVTLMLYLAEAISGKPREGQKKLTNPTEAVLTTTGILGVYIVGYLAIFAAFLYPRIPANLGGGQPIGVRFVIHERLDQVVQTADGSPITVPYNLISSAGGFYTVTLPNEGAAIRIRHDDVSAVLYELEN
ncbi:MAG: hypothetical protein ACI9C2_002308 [Gammaproteobacteria bacterium]|jgi:hypothetical protein